MVPAVLEAFSVDNSIRLGKQVRCLIVTVFLLSFFPHQWAYMYVLLKCTLKCAGVGGFGQSLHLDA